MGLLWGTLKHSVFTFALLYNSQSIYIITHSHQELHIASHSPSPSHISPQHNFKGCLERTLWSHLEYTTNHEAAGKLSRKML